MSRKNPSLITHSLLGVAKKKRIRCQRGSQGRQKCLKSSHIGIDMDIAIDKWLFLNAL